MFVPSPLCIGMMPWTLVSIVYHCGQISVYAVPEKIDQAEFALDAAVRLLDFYDDYFDIPYPLPKQGKCM